MFANAKSLGGSQKGRNIRDTFFSPLLQEEIERQTVARKKKENGHENQNERKSGRIEPQLVGTAGQNAREGRRVGGQPQSGWTAGQDAREGRGVGGQPQSLPDA